VFKGGFCPAETGDPELFVGIIKLKELQSLLGTNSASRYGSQFVLAKTEEVDFSQYGYKCRLPILITGDTEARARNVVFVNGNKVTIGDVSFSLLLRLMVELFKNKHGKISRRKLINGSYINADGEFQSISRLRQTFNGALDGLSPQEFIETCENKCIRLSVHPSLISYNKQKLLYHRNQRIRKLAQRLP
jgi:hypothetical protein